MTMTTIDNIVSKFEYKTLNRIHGEPLLNTVLQLYNQLKRNAQRIPTTLGGGQYGYLALVVKPADYM